MYNTDSTSQDTQIKGITGLNVWCSLVEDESSLSLSLPPRGGFEWWNWYVFYIYLYQGCILLTDGWPEASELVLIGVQTQLRNHKKSQKGKITQRPYKKKMNGDFVLTSCWSFHCLKLLTYLAQVNNILKQCKPCFICL